MVSVVITRKGERAIRALTLLVILAALCPFVAVRVDAQIPPQVSQFIGVSAQIADEKGELLNGTDKFAAQYGVSPVLGDFVQVLYTADGVIYPPLANGAPDSRNVIIQTSRIGAGMSPALARSGKFSTALTPRPSGGSRIFVRVFNDSTPEGASFYGDSQVFTVSAVSNTTFMAAITSTDKALRPDDADGDGLIDSLEIAQGSDPYAADTDGDDYSDADEYVAGTDALSENSFPMITSIASSGAGLSKLTWSPMVSGRTYRVYYSESLAGMNFGTNIAGIYVSTGMNDFITITNADFSDTGVFSIKITKEGVNN